MTNGEPERFVHILEPQVSRVGIRIGVRMYHLNDELDRKFQEILNNVILGNGRLLIDEEFKALSIEYLSSLPEGQLADYSDRYFSNLGAFHGLFLSDQQYLKAALFWVYRTRFLGHNFAAAHAASLIL